MKRRHRKAHRILTTVLLLASVAVLTLAVRSWIGTPVPEAVPPPLASPEGAGLP